MNAQTIEETKAYFRPLCFGDEAQVAQKTFFHLLRQDDSDREGLAQACGFEIPETHKLFYGRGCWQLLKRAF